MSTTEMGHDGPGQRLHTAPELDQIEAELALARARVAASMHALGEQVSRRADWRAWVRERPLWAMGAALALGFLLGLKGRRPSWT
jgi:hypothetical protein